MTHETRKKLAQAINQHPELAHALLAALTPPPQRYATARPRLTSNKAKYLGDPRT